VIQVKAKIICPFLKAARSPNLEFEGPHNLASLLSLVASVLVSKIDVATLDFDMISD
jgi:hypothetical protein